MDLYTQPAESKYILGLTRWFQMPQENGKTIPALAVSQNQSNYWNSGYTILIMLLFGAVGQIVFGWVATWFPLKNNGNRHAILVTFLNTSDPIAALLVLGLYQWRLLFRIKTKPDGAQWIDRDWTTLGLTTVLWLIVFMVFGASFAAGIVIPSELMMGNMARVNPNVIFYPAILPTNSTALQREANNRLARAAAFRAIGTVEISEGILQQRIKFGNSLRLSSNGADISLDYTYNITGFDFGLQRAPGLIHAVSGHCQTEYTWTQNSSNSTHDIYWLWGNSSMERIVPIPSSGNYTPPRANFEVPPKNIADAKSTGSAWFSILPYTAGRRSRVEFNQTQPWYVTEDLNDTITNSRYAVQAKRPAISCSHNTTWYYGESIAKNTYDLKSLVQSGLKVAPFWLDTVFIREFTSVPPIVTMSRNLGYSNLVSFSEGFAINNRVENSAANIIDDLKYLIMGSFVYSREVVRNTAMLSPNREGLLNAAEINGVVPDETADFVLESKDIQTLSCRLLIYIPSIILALWLFIGFQELLLSIVSYFRNDKGFGISKFISRTVGFSAIQLYRYLDEELSGQRRWEGRLSSAPYIGVVDLGDEEHKKKHSRGNESSSETRKVSVPVSAQYPASSVVDPKLTSTEMEYDNSNHFKESKYAAPKLIQLYNPSRSETTASSNSAKGQAETKETITEIPPQTKDDPKYELAMVTSWYPIHRGKKLWESVQKKSTVR
jgi:hypothetical protein